MAKKDLDEVIKANVKPASVIPVAPVIEATVDTTTEEDKIKEEVAAKSAEFQAAIKKIVTEHKLKTA